MAALYAHDVKPDLNILIVTKALKGKGGCSRMVQGGFNVVLNPKDSHEKHLMDTLKGGLSARSAELMAQYGACYLSVTGGAAAPETLQIAELEKVYWGDLMPECIWQFRFRGLGPLTVGIDTHGGNLQLEVQQQAQQRAAELLQKLGAA